MIKQILYTYDVVSEGHKVFQKYFHYILLPWTINQSIDMTMIIGRMEKI
jgi:hypothetical protein